MNYKPLFIITIVLLVVTGISSIVYFNKYSKTKIELAEVQSEVDEKQEKIDELEDEISSLENTVKSVKNDLSDCEDEKSNLSDEVDDLDFKNRMNYLQQDVPQEEKIIY
jgi:septal ring factor EnvC (AmiA/AmiB activator)